MTVDQQRHVENTKRQLVNLGFPADRAEEAAASIGDPSDVQAAMNWLLDHGEEDRGGAVEFKHCPHVDELGFQALLPRDRLAYGQPCLEGCAGKENWLCLHCGETRCGRYGLKHSMAHWQATKGKEEATLTIAAAAQGRQPLGHCLVLASGDLSIWCYECNSYVQHETLQPISKQMEALKFGGATGSAVTSAAPVPSVGTPLQAAAMAMHGRLGDPAWSAPRLARACAEEARPGYKTKLAHEYVDQPEVLAQKVKLLAELIQKSQNCVAYTGAGISTASGIDDYASKASDSVARSSKQAGGKISPWAARPTLAHHALVALRRAGRLKHWVQQNHDGLPQKAGYPQQEINEIHGAWFDPSNPVVPMDGTLREDLIKWLLEWEDKVDLCLALGTSMVGMNADRIPVAAAQRAKSDQAIGTVIVALQETQYDQASSLRIFAPIDEVMKLLAAEMGLQLPQEADLAAAVPESPHDQLFADLPYGPDGKHDPSAKLTLDLRQGSWVQIVNQPDWDQQRWGSEGQVIEPQTSLQDGRHFAIRMGGKETAPIRVLGRWWLDAARRGEVPSIPVVPVVPK